MVTAEQVRWPKSQWFSNLPLHRKLIAVFGSLLLVISLVLAVISLVFVNFRIANELTRHSLSAVALGDAWSVNLNRAQGAYQNYLLTGESAYLDDYESSRQEYFRLLDELVRTEASHNPEQSARWQSLERLLDQRRDEVTLPGIELRRRVDRGEATTGEIDTYVSSAASQNQLTELVAAVDAVKRYEVEFLQEQTVRAMNAQAWLQRTMVAGILLILITGIILTVVLLRDLIPPVTRLSRVAHEIADGQLDRRIGIQRGDELGEMADSFDRMADRVHTLVQDQQASLRSIQEHEAVVQAVMDGVSVGILMIDSDARVAIANQPACDLLGLTNAELFGYSPDELADLVSRIFVDARRVHSAFGGDLFASDETMTVVFEQDVPLARHLEVYTAPVHSTAGDRLGRIFALRDVTQEREVDRMKTEFVSMVSHELRTPLTSIKGYVDLIREGEVGPMSEEQAAFLTIVANSTDRLVALINDLLDISRIESGKIELKREQIDLAALIQSISTAFRPQLAAKQQTLRLTLPPVPLPILADVDRIAQVLTNLLSNAHKYSPAGGIIELEAVNLADTVEVHVTDTGIGISASEQSQLFTRFYRATNKVVQDAGGTGLGLAITRSLVELHGGSIRVKSVAGEGSTFTVSLPLAVVDGKENERAAPPDQPGQRRLLVVEDEAAIAGLLQRYLQRAGYQVVTAATASEGLRQARWLRPDLITLDVQLPDVDGFVLLEWLREDPDTRDIPVVFISISPDDGHGQRLGAVDHLTKPVDETTLLNRVGQILSGDGKFVILVADDDPDTRHLIVDLLRRAGHRTIEAQDGAGAVAAAENAPQLDLALIDVRMPGTDGLEALRTLRTQARTSALPIVMMTASAGVESSRSDIEALGATLVQKPLATRDLVDAISAMLDRRDS